MTPHPDNVPGDFYVEDQCCLLCDVPIAEAPELFAYVDDPARSPHCFVRRQPESATELLQMLTVLQYSETQCIRYRGCDPEMQRILGKLGHGRQCDNLPADSQNETKRRESPWWRRFWPFRRRSSG